MSALKSLNLKINNKTEHRLLGPNKSTKINLFFFTIADVIKSLFVVFKFKCISFLKVTKLKVTIPFLVFINLFTLINVPGFIACPHYCKKIVSVCSKSILSSAKMTFLFRLCCVSYWTMRTNSRIAMLIIQSIGSLQSEIRVSTEKNIVNRV